MEPNPRGSWKANWKVWTYSAGCGKETDIFERNWQGAKQFNGKTCFIADYKIHVNSKEKTWREQGPCLSSSLLYPQNKTHTHKILGGLDVVREEERTYGREKAKGTMEEKGEGRGIKRR